MATQACARQVIATNTTTAISRVEPSTVEVAAGRLVTEHLGDGRVHPKEIFWAVQGALSQTRESAQASRRCTTTTSDALVRRSLSIAESPPRD